MRFKELSYANENDPPLKRWFIRSIEGLSGRNRYVKLYDKWRSGSVGKSERVFGEMLDLIRVKLSVAGEWPPRALPEAPLVIVANHPFGIGDGIAVLSLAEQLGRPFRVMIHNDLLKIPEMAPYALPVSFEETQEAARRRTCPGRCSRPSLSRRRGRMSSRSISRARTAGSSISPASCR